MQLRKEGRRCDSGEMRLLLSLGFSRRIKLFLPDFCAKLGTHRIVLEIESVGNLLAHRCKAEQFREIEFGRVHADPSDEVASLPNRESIDCDSIATSATLLSS